MVGTPSIKSVTRALLMARTSMADSVYHPVILDDGTEIKDTLLVCEIDGRLTLIINNTCYLSRIAVAWGDTFYDGMPCPEAIRFLDGLVKTPFQSGTDLAYVAWVIHNQNQLEEPVVNVCTIRKQLFWDEAVSFEKWKIDS